MLKERERSYYEYKALNPHLSYNAKKALRQEIHQKAKKLTKCPFCGMSNGMVKKGPGLLRIVHNIVVGKTKKNAEPGLTESDSHSETSDDDSETEKFSEELNPLTVLELFKMIPESDILLLCMNTKYSKPTDLLVTKLFVPPVCIRPSVASEFKSGT